ncbi:MAG: hypothetical protein ACRC10_10920 [Thermoguttaceae bacterium]
MQRKTPQSLRLMLLAVFAPLLLCYISLYFFTVVPLHRTVFGISNTYWSFTILFFFPCLMGLFLYFTGYWKLTLFLLLCTLSSYGILLEVIGVEPVRQPKIELAPYFLRNLDVYCNDVFLGTTPFTMTVEELQAKVPVWTEPPTQEWYYGFDQGVITNGYLFKRLTCSYIPWDTFLPKRKDEFIELTKKIQNRRTRSQRDTFSTSTSHESDMEYDTFCNQSQYWWKFVSHNETAVVSYDLERLTNRQPFRAFTPLSSVDHIVFPSATAQTKIVQEVLLQHDYQPTPDWIAYVNENWYNIFYPAFVTNLSERVCDSEECKDDGGNFFFQLNDMLNNSKSSFDSIILFEDVVDGQEDPSHPKSRHYHYQRLFDIERLIPAVVEVAKYRYGLSVRPTEEECEQAIRQMEEENRQFAEGSVYGELRNLFYNQYSTDYRFWGRWTNCQDLLTQYAVKNLGPESLGPIRRRFEEDPNSALSLFLLLENPFQELFQPLLCQYAENQNGYNVVFHFSNEKVLPLFTMLLKRKGWSELFNTGDMKNMPYINMTAFFAIDNPQLEPTIWAYIAKWLPEILEYEQKLGYANRDIMSDFVITRLQLSWVDRTEFANWIRSLPLSNQVIENLTAQIETSIVIPGFTHGPRPENLRLADDDQFPAIPIENPEKMLHELLIGERTPQSLLKPHQPWIWRDGKYQQEGENEEEEQNEKVEPKSGETDI